MGWVWKNDDDDFSSGGVPKFGDTSNPSCGGSDDGDGGHCATRKIVRSQCRTEEVEPGKFIRKCEKTEQIFKHSVGRPSEMVQSNKEYTEEDVTDQMVKGSFPPASAEHEPFYFSGLRSDLEAIERDFLGGIGQFFQAAEEMKNEFFNSVGVPHMFDENARSSCKERRVPIEAPRREEAFTRRNSDGDIDFSGVARDV
ncbi:hypothetical protein OROGR_024005 [Orobanche gracilis]